MPPRHLYTQPANRTQPASLRHSLTVRTALLPRYSPGQPRIPIPCTSGESLMRLYLYSLRYSPQALQYGIHRRNKHIAEERLTRTPLAVAGHARDSRVGRRQEIGRRRLGSTQARHERQAQRRQEERPAAETSAYNTVGIGPAAARSTQNPSPPRRSIRKFIAIAHTLTLLELRRSENRPWPGT